MQKAGGGVLRNTETLAVKLFVQLTRGQAVKIVVNLGGVDRPSLGDESTGTCTEHRVTVRLGVDVHHFGRNIFDKGVRSINECLLLCCVHCEHASGRTGRFPQRRSDQTFHRGNGAVKRGTEFARSRRRHRDVKNIFSCYVGGGAAQRS